MRRRQQRAIERRRVFYRDRIAEAETPIARLSAAMDYYRAALTQLDDADAARYAGELTTHLMNLADRIHTKGARK